MPPILSGLVRSPRRRGSAFATSLTLLLVSFGAFGLAAAPAGATTLATASSVFTTSPFAGLPTFSEVAGETEQGDDSPIVCNGCMPPLTYHGGPILGTVAQAGALTITPIFWAPGGVSSTSGTDGVAGSSFDPDYVDVIDKFIFDIAAASGLTSNVFAVNQEYSRATTPAGGDQIKYALTANLPGPANPGGYSENANHVSSTQTSTNFALNSGIIDTDAYPTVGSMTTGTTPVAATCAIIQAAVPPAPATGPTPYTNCITDAAVQAEIAKVMAGTATTNLPVGTTFPLPADLAHIYVVFLPNGVQEAQTSTSYSGVQFCAYHGSFTNAASQPVIDSIDTYPVNGCYSGAAPEYNYVNAYGIGARSGDYAISTLSHELDEAITDPQYQSQYSWYDSSGHEIGDECSGIYGAALGSTATATLTATTNPAAYYNQIINGDPYYTQGTFSNATYAAFKTAQGCVTKAFVPQGGASPATQPAPDLGTGRVSASALTLPADGTSTSMITETVNLQDGEPVVGDDVTFNDQVADGSNGECGSLSGDDTSASGKGEPIAGVSGVTNDDGQVSVTYTASDTSTMCDIVATEANGGTSSTLTLAQGTDAQQAPSITADGLPSTITTGSVTPVTFTTTTNNPGETDVEGALQTVYLYGGDTGSTGIDASQVQLSYANDSTGGSFVTVPLTGTTVSDGAISGTTLPVTGTTLAAGDTQTTTWHLSILAGAPATPAANPLTIETDLDSIDPASGSDTNLDYDTAQASVVAGTPVTPPVVTPTTITTTVIEPTTTTTLPGATATVIETVPAKAVAATRCTVPKLAGDSPKTATAALHKAGCTSVTLIEPAAKKGQTLVVKTTSAKAGTKLPIGGTLTVKFKTITKRK